MATNDTAASMTGLSASALDAAFAEVLAAERAAEEAVAACRTEAERRQTAAEAAARDLAERAATRRRAWCDRQASALAREVADLQLRCAAAATPQALVAAAHTRLAAAVERLADELCGTGSKAG